MKLLEGTKIPVLGKALDAYALRHKAISTNIANVATPGYRAKGVEFEERLATALKEKSIGTAQTNPRHFGSGDSLGGVWSQVADLPGEKEGGEAADASGVNNVDFDHEMVELAKNQIRFRFSARMIADTFRGIQKSIRGTV